MQNYHGKFADSERIFHPQPSCFSSAIGKMGPIPSSPIVTCPLHSHRPNAILEVLQQRNIYVMKIMGLSSKR
jgi:hypothetical protein